MLPKPFKDILKTNVKQVVNILVQRSLSYYSIQAYFLGMVYPHTYHVDVRVKKELLNVILSEC